MRPAAVAQRVAGKRARAEHVVDLDEVRAVEEVEHLEHRREREAAREPDRPRETHVRRHLRRQPLGVPADRRRGVRRRGARAIGGRQAVAVQVRACKRRERDPGCGREDAREREVPGRHPRAAHHEPMRLVRVGGTLLAVRIESNRQARGTGRVATRAVVFHLPGVARDVVLGARPRVRHAQLARRRGTAASPTAGGRDTTSRRSR